MESKTKEKKNSSKQYKPQLLEKLQQQAWCLLSTTFLFFLPAIKYKSRFLFILFSTLRKSKSKTNLSRPISQVLREFSIQLRFKPKVYLNQQTLKGSGYYVYKVPRMISVVVFCEVEQMPHLDFSTSSVHRKIL